MYASFDRNSYLENFNYLVPDPLLRKDEFKSLSLSAKLVYGILRTEMMNSRYKDKDGYIYVKYTDVRLSETLNVSLDEVHSLYEELEDFGLLEALATGEDRWGDGILYLGNFKSKTTKENAK